MYSQTGNCSGLERMGEKYKVRNMFLLLKSILHYFRSGTVVGLMEGQEDRVGEMRRWLQNVGSPKSRIDNVEFTEEKMIEKLSFQAFEIRK